MIKGNTGINNDNPTEKLDVVGNIKATGTILGSNLKSDMINLANSKTPISSTSIGSKGDICWDSDYVYVCVAINTWKRTALTTW